MLAPLYVAYGVASYLFFFATFVYMIGFAGALQLPLTVDAGRASGSAVEAFGVDVALLALFAIQHSVMARASFKRVWAKVVPAAIERSTYVLASTAALGLILWQWRSITEPVVWEATGTLRLVVQGLFWVGWGVMLWSSWMIDHFELFGLRQVWRALRNQRAGEPVFRTPLLYRYVRHPLYVGVLLGVWATPRMTAGHLLFAAGFTFYILVGIYFEERDLIAAFGSRYATYRRNVGMLLPKRRPLG